MGEWEDPRALYMCNWVLNSLKFKADKWKKMVNVEECKYVVFQYHSVLAFLAQPHP